MYHSVESLIEDLTHSPPSDHSDSDENCSETERTSSVPTNIKRPGNFNFRNVWSCKINVTSYFKSACFTSGGSETREQNGEATGEPVSLVSTGKIFLVNFTVILHLTMCLLHNLKYFCNEYILF